MKFEWNEAKRSQNLAKHSVDLVYAALIFDGPIISAVDDRQDYGETRHIAVGAVDDQIFVVVYTWREDRIRLISARPGGRKDYVRYKEHIDR